MQEILPNRVYKHFKGDYYLVEDIVGHSETKEVMVLYRALYGDGRLWVRPYEMFAGEVDHTKYPGILQQYRFELQGRFDGPRYTRRKIVIAGSSDFWLESLECKAMLETAGFEVTAYLVRDDAESWRALYESFWEKLLQADDIFVLNLDKKNIPGYIGSESFAELSAMVVRKMRGEDVHVYLQQLPSRKCACYGEIMEMRKLGWVEVWGEKS